LFYFLTVSIELKALDDLQITKNYKCVVTPKHADPIEHAIQSVSCDFEMTLCAWKMDFSYETQWHFPGHFIRPSELQEGAESSHGYLLALPTYHLGIQIFSSLFYVKFLVKFLNCKQQQQ
jgi:hypothetical protein